MDPEEAKRIVLGEHEKRPINATWLAKEIGEPNKQTVWNWINGKRNPDDEKVWPRIAAALGLLGVDTALAESAREFALDVLVTTENEALKIKAANLIREISKKTSPNR